MLLHQATLEQDPGFVHVTSAADHDASYTMTVAVPPAYSWLSVPSQVSQSFGAVELDIQQDGAIAVDLQFGFPFFGVGDCRLPTLAVVDQNGFSAGVLLERRMHDGSLRAAGRQVRLVELRTGTP